LSRSLRTAIAFKIAFQTLKAPVFILFFQFDPGWSRQIQRDHYFCRVTQFSRSAYQRSQSRSL